MMAPRRLVILSVSFVSDTTKSNALASKANRRNKPRNQMNKPAHKFGKYGY